MEKEPMLCVLLLHPNARASDPRSGSDQKGRVHPSDQVEISVLALRMTAILASGLACTLRSAVMHCQSRRRSLPIRSNWSLSLPCRHCLRDQR